MSSLSMFSRPRSLEYVSKRTVTEDMKKQIAQVFYECDEKHKGFLTREDLKIAVVSLFGYKPSKYEVNDILKSLPDDAPGMPLDMFLEKMSAKMEIEDEDEHIRQVFLSMDTHCQGFLTIKDLEHAVRSVAPHLPLHAIQSAFKEIDRDGDGRVSYKDFEYMMKYCLDDDS